MSKKRYVPDISVFFPEKRVVSLNDLLDSQVLKQETVTFDKNDFYMKSANKGTIGKQVNFSKNFKKRRRNRAFRRTYP